MILLHLTDLHLSSENRSEFEKRWLSLIRHLCLLPGKWQPDAVALTGDLCHRGDLCELTRITEYVRSLCAQFNIPAENVFSCQGNHDCILTEKGTDFSYFQQAHEKAGLCIRVRHQQGYFFIPVNSADETSRPAIRHLLKRNFAGAEEAPIILMHHPPTTLFSEKTDSTSLSARLILSGHNHPVQPKIQYYGKALSVNGCAFTPKKENHTSGCQMIRLDEDGKIQVAALISKTARNPNYTFQEVGAYSVSA